MKKLLLLLVLSFGFGAIINVPDDYSTIQGGIDAASEGDTVLVAAGTYSPLTNSEIFPIEMVSRIHLIGSGTPLITYSDIEGGWEGEGNIDDNPLFFDSDNSHYTLQAGSPCIDSGTVIEGMECWIFP